MSTTRDPEAPAGHGAGPGAPEAFPGLGPAGPFPVDRLLLGACGSIAAALLPAALIWIRQGLRVAETRVIMTPAATSILPATTIAAFAGSRVHVDWSTWDEPEAAHVALARWAEALVVMPASGNTLAKIAAGIADNLLCTTVLAADCPVILAPAMSAVMWRKPATQRNVDRIRADGMVVLPPGPAMSTSGAYSDAGGMAPVPVVLEHVRRALAEMLPHREDGRTPS